MNRIKNEIIKDNFIFNTILTISLISIDFLIGIQLFLKHQSFYLFIIVTIILSILLCTIWFRKCALYRFILPALIVIFLLSGFPVCYTIWISFTNIDGDTRETKSEVRDLLLHDQWHFDSSKMPVFAKFYFEKSEINNLLKEYLTLKDSIDIQYDAVFEKNLPINKENIALATIDREIDTFIKRKMNQFSLQNIKVVFYLNESGIEKKYIYIPNKKNTDYKNIETITIENESLQTELNDYVLLGSTDTDNEYSLVDIKWMNKFIEELKNANFIIHNKFYYNEYGNRFINKIPLYIENHENEHALLKFNEKTNAYDILIQEDDVIGRFVITENDEKPFHGEKLEVLFPDFSYSFFHPFRTDFVPSFFSGKINSSGFYNQIDTIFPHEYLKSLETAENTTETRKVLKQAIKRANAEVKKINRMINGKNGFKNEFRQTFFRKTVFSPTLSNFSYTIAPTTNILPNGYISPGYRVYTGFKHYIHIFRDKGLQSYYLKLFGWTIRWALLSVFLSFSSGLFFAMILNKKKLYGKRIYRTLLLLPYAVPASISIMMWNIFLNTDFGSINSIIGYPVPWLTDELLSKLTSIIINVWLSFPYFMIICLGALQSIDTTLYEVASVDGALKKDTFFMITLPLLLTVTAPLIVGYFGYSFNNFTIIYLLNGRGTNIVISFIYNIATRERLFAFASAVSFITFLLITPITYLQIKANNTTN